MKAGDSYDGAVAETIHGLLKTELIKPNQPSRTFEEVEVATLQWVLRHHNTHLYSELSYQTNKEIKND